MANIDTFKAISHLVPGAKFSILNNSITWEDSRPQPSQDEIDLVMARLPEITAEGVKRSFRNSLLSSSDWTVLPYSPLSEADQQAWVSYRQELRDFTAQTGWVDLEFPTPPQ